jgi:hypothetical protein
VPARVALCVVFVAAVIVGVAGGTARAEDKGVFGIGLIVGEPTGVCGKYYLGNDTAIDGAAGAAFLGRGVQVHSDFLWHPWVLDSKESFALPVYLGAGLRILNHDASGEDEDHVRIGLRIPAGIVFDFTKIPLDVFAEVALVGDYHTAGDASFGIDFNGGAGARYYF